MGERKCARVCEIKARIEVGVSLKIDKRMTKTGTMITYASRQRFDTKPSCGKENNDVHYLSTASDLRGHMAVILVVSLSLFLSLFLSLPHPLSVTRSPSVWYSLILRLPIPQPLSVIPHLLSVTPSPLACHSLTPLSVTSSPSVCHIPAQLDSRSWHHPSRIKDADYVKGVGEANIFNAIYRFTQWNTFLLVVANSSSHCVRLVDRTSNQTSTFVGLHTQRGFTDGEGQDALFNIPYSLIEFKSTSLTCQWPLQKCHKTGRRGTCYRKRAHYWHSITKRHSNGRQRSAVLCISLLRFGSGRCRINFEVLTSTEPGLQHGNILSFHYMFLTSIDRLDNDTLVVTDSIASRIRMISLSHN